MYVLILQFTLLYQYRFTFTYVICIFIFQDFDHHQQIQTGKQKTKKHFFSSFFRKLINNNNLNLLKENLEIIQNKPKRPSY